MTRSRQLGPRNSCSQATQGLTLPHKRLSLQRKKGSFLPTQEPWVEPSNHLCTSMSTWRQCYIPKKRVRHAPEKQMHLRKHHVCRAGAVQTIDEYDFMMLTSSIILSTRLNSHLSHPLVSPRISKLCNHLPRCFPWWPGSN